MIRTIIKIDEKKCNGCGVCISGCHEGALQLINGKAVMVSDLYCDGLGACIGDCPVDAITFEERKAEPYNECAVMERLLPQGSEIMKAHLNHLKEHGETELYQQGLNYLKENNINIDINDLQHTAAVQLSELRQFPVQLHLLNPQAGFFRKENVLLAADCTAFASGEFHSRFLKGKMLAIACPKLDANQQTYIDKLTVMIDVAQIDTLTVLIMEVPCCGGLVHIAEKAREQAKRHIPIKVIVLSVQGELISEKWM